MKKRNYAFAVMVLVILAVPSLALQPATGMFIAQGDLIPAGFGSPWDVQSDGSKYSGRLIVSADFANNKLIVGVSNTEFIWPMGYYYNNVEAKWIPFNLEGTKKISGWIAGSASANVMLSSWGLKMEDNYVVVYTCRRIDDAWKCGCRTPTDCGKWQIQTFNVPPGAENTCGNGQVDLGEDCDGTTFPPGANTCQRVNSRFNAGTLKCAQCKFDTSSCSYSGMAGVCTILSANWQVATPPITGFAIDRPWLSDNKGITGLPVPKPLFSITGAVTANECSEIETNEDPCSNEEYRGCANYETTCKESSNTITRIACYTESTNVNAKCEEKLKIDTSDPCIKTVTLQHVQVDDTGSIAIEGGPVIFDKAEWCAEYKSANGISCPECAMGTTVAKDITNYINRLGDTTFIFKDENSCGGGMRLIAFFNVMKLIPAQDEYCENGQLKKVQTCPPSSCKSLDSLCAGCDTTMTCEDGKKYWCFANKWTDTIPVCDASNVCGKSNYCGEITCYKTGDWVYERLEEMCCDGTKALIDKGGCKKLGMNKITCSDLPGCAPVCGNGICEKGETGDNCPEDCANIEGIEAQDFVAYGAEFEVVCKSNVSRYIPGCVYSEMDNVGGGTINLTYRDIDKYRQEFFTTAPTTGTSVTVSCRTGGTKADGKTLCRPSGPLTKSVKLVRNPVCPDDLEICDRNTTCEPQDCGGTNYYCRQPFGQSTGGWITLAQAPSCSATNNFCASVYCGGKTFKCTVLGGIWNWYDVDIINTTSDPKNCGSVCNVCPTNNPLCSKGRCTHNPVCGDGICETDLGETPENCPEDCAKILGISAPDSALQGSLINFTCVSNIGKPVSGCIIPSVQGGISYVQTGAKGGNVSYTFKAPKDKDSVIISCMTGGNKPDGSRICWPSGPITKTIKLEPVYTDCKSYMAAHFTCVPTPLQIAAGYACGPVCPLDGQRYYCIDNDGYPSWNTTYEIDQSCDEPSDVCNKINIEGCYEYKTCFATTKAGGGRGYTWVTVYGQGFELKEEVCKDGTVVPYSTCPAWNPAITCEDSRICAEPVCGNHICEPQETGSSCSEDCAGIIEVIAPRTVLPGSTVDVICKSNVSVDKTGCVYASATGINKLLYTGSTGADSKFTFKAPSTEGNININCYTGGRYCRATGPVSRTILVSSTSQLCQTELNSVYTCKLGGIGAYSNICSAKCSKDSRTYECVETASQIAWMSRDEMNLLCDEPSELCTTIRLPGCAQTLTCYANGGTGGYGWVDESTKTNRGTLTTNGCAQPTSCTFDYCSSFLTECVKTCGGQTYSCGGIDRYWTWRSEKEMNLACTYASSCKTITYPQSCGRTPEVCYPSIQKWLPSDKEICLDMTVQGKGCCLLQGKSSLSCSSSNIEVPADLVVNKNSKVNLVMRTESCARSSNFLDLEIKNTEYPEVMAGPVPSKYYFGNMDYTDTLISEWTPMFQGNYRFTASIGDSQMGVRATRQSGNLLVQP